MRKFFSICLLVIAAGFALLGALTMINAQSSQEEQDGMIMFIIAMIGGAFVVGLIWPLDR